MNQENNAYEPSAVKYITYLIYIILWEVMVFGGIGYAVFVLEESPGWFVLAYRLGVSAYRPEQWIHGRERTNK